MTPARRLSANHRRISRTAPVDATNAVSGSGRCYGHSQPRNLSRGTSAASHPVVNFAAVAKIDNMSCLSNDAANRLNYRLRKCR
jgi:hypothetical protein